MFFCVAFPSMAEEFPLVSPFTSNVTQVWLRFFFGLSLFPPTLSELIGFPYLVSFFPFYCAAWMVGGSLASSTFSITKPDVVYRLSVFLTCLPVPSLFFPQAPRGIPPPLTQLTAIRKEGALGSVPYLLFFNLQGAVPYLAVSARKRGLPL